MLKFVMKDLPFMYNIILAYHPTGLGISRLPLNFSATLGGRISSLVDEWHNLV